MNRPSLMASRWRSGLQLAARKQISAGRSIRDAPLPERLVVPLQEGPAGPARPLVRTGQRVLRGQPLTERSGPLGTAVHASSSGTVRAIGAHPVADPQRDEAVCAIIDCDGDDTPWPALQPPAAADCEPDRLEQTLAAGGLTGLGGALYPVGRKLARARRQGLRALIINGAECEPYISCDDRLMRERPVEVLQGARAMLDLTGCPRALVAIEADKQEAFAALAEALGMLALHPRVSLTRLPASYPSGDERRLIQLLTGDEVPAAGVATDIGYLCHNVATAAALARFLATGEPLLSRIVTVTGGALARPANLRVRFGTLMCELIQACGGYRRPVNRLIMGGGMTGLAVSTDGLPVGRATSCLIAAADGELRPAGGALPCIRCGSCSDVCPAGLMPQLLHRETLQDRHASLQALDLFACIECGSCDVVCPSRIPLTQQFRAAKRRIWDAASERERAQRARRRHQARQERLQRREQQRREELEAHKARVQQGGQSDDPIREIMERVRRRKGQDE